MRRRKLFPTIKQIMLRSTLDSEEKLILIAIRLHSDREGCAKVPVRGQLDKDTGLSEATIKKRIKGLVARGVLLKISDGARTANRYWIELTPGIFKDVAQG
ncbi:MAG: hypothetical protein WAN12_07545 [Candidatus Acidiferrum sp.]